MTITMTAPEHSEAVSLTLATLTKRADFLKAARGKRVPCDAFLLQARRRAASESRSNSEDRDPEGHDAQARVGFTCSKKVGNAVARNRAKRRLREIARLVLPMCGRPGWDYVLVGRAERTATRDFALMQEDLRRALSKVHAGPS